MRATLGVSLAYGGLLTLIGAFILGGLLVWGFTPFIIVAAGAFLLVGPALLAGFFGIARAHEAGLQVGAGTTARGFANADPALWVIALVCLLLFMIFLTDAAILYSYMVGGAPQALTDLWPMPAGVASFLFWSMVSGLIIGFLLFCVSAFSVPLLSERRAPLVAAVVASTRAVFGSLLPAMGWAALLAMLVIGSILLLPLLPLTLPWLAYASHALYRRVFP
ncbi:MAG: DUF2189 domain-containing protein [Rhodocyclaceae bacterium]|nr:DUF2189 domain-containing protein [Rhodocyclaceae bacterium]